MSVEFLHRYFPESVFGGFTDIDGSIAFYSRVNALLRPDDTVLDIGCGRGAWLEDDVAIRRDLRAFQGRCAKVVGIDVDEAARQNPGIDEFHILDPTRAWSVADATVDLCVCDNVLEHVEDPDRFFAESRRVLRPGGYLCIRTPNALGYVAVISRLVPGRRHAAVLRHAQPERKEEDVFPTLYRCNTRRKVRAMLRKHAFDSCVYGYEAEPSYLAFSRFCYFLGVLHQRFAPGLFKAALFAFGRKRY